MKWRGVFLYVYVFVCMCGRYTRLWGPTASRHVVVQ